MKMIHMRQPPASIKSLASATMPAQPSYPSGLELHLDGDTLDKLGMKTLPKVGAKMKLHGLGAVTSVSSHAGQNTSHRSVRVQLHHMGMESDEPMTAQEKREQARAEFSEALDAQKKG